MINQIAADIAHIPPMQYETSFENDKPSGAIHIYVEHTNVINSAGNSAI